MRIFKTPRATQFYVLRMALRCYKALTSKVDGVEWSPRMPASVKEDVSGNFLNDTCIIPLECNNFDVHGDCDHSRPSIFNGCRDERHLQSSV